jgi:hypothetical protein
MRRFITAIAAAAITTAHADTGPQEPVGLIRVVGVIFTAATGFKTLMEVWDWATQRWLKPPLKAAQIWLCSSCGFSQLGSPPTMGDHAQGENFIKQAFSGRQWQAGQGIIVCNGTTCFKFQFDGNSHFYASDVAFADPLVGYANPGGMMPSPAPAPRPSRGGGGETGAPYAPRSTTVWSPAVVYNPGSRPTHTGTVTVIPGPGVTFGGGGGGGGHFIGPLPGD